MYAILITVYHSVTSNLVGCEEFYYIKASLAQSVERETLNLKVAGSTPAWGWL